MTRTQFTVLVELHRRELQVHCYRLLGSFDESQDAVQDTFLRAWRSRATARGAESGGSWRAWQVTTFGPEVFGPLGLPERL